MKKVSKSILKEEVDKIVERLKKLGLSSGKESLDGEILLEIGRDDEDEERSFVTLNDFLFRKIYYLCEQNAKEKTLKIYEDWETAIRFSQCDEDDVPVEQRKLSEIVMINWFENSKE